MTLALKDELIFLLFSFLFGIAVGCYYDVFRFLRVFLGLRAVSIKEGEKEGKRIAAKIVTGVLDFLFMLSGGIAYTVLVYGAHSGIVRFYSLLALFFGFLLYLKTLSRLVLVPLFLLARATRRVAKTVFYPFFRIAYVISRIFLHIIRIIRCFLQKNVLNYNRRSKKRNTKKTKNTLKEKSEKPVEAFVFGKRV